MREILFQGKRVDNGEWTYGYYVKADYHWHKHGIHKDWIICGAGANGGWFVLHEKHAVIPSTIGQYTGKVVKTGKVFDGDIGKSIDGIFLVCWDDEKAAFVMRFNEYPYETLYLEEMWDDAEIIGNIHDNPELLGGNNEV